MPSKVKDSKLWWQGPRWLSCEPREWPVSKVQEKDSRVSEEEKKKAGLLRQQDQRRDIYQVVDLSRHSKLVSYRMRIQTGFRVPSFTYRVRRTFSKMVS